MRAILATLIFCLTFSVLPAEAKYRYRHHHVSHHFGRYLAQRHLHYPHRRFAARHVGARPSCFYTAASMGGPCGCWAAAHLLNVVDHVWRGVNLWLANDWLKFPHVAAAPGTAAVWPGRHVAPVVAVNGDGTVIVNDSWNSRHRVRMAGLIFVQPLRGNNDTKP